MKWGSYLSRINPHQADVSESLIRRGKGEQICPTKEIGYISFIFALYAIKMGSRNSGETKVAPHGSRTRHGPSMDPTMALQYTKYGPLYIGYIFVFYATKMGSRDSGDTKVHPHSV